MFLKEGEGRYTDPLYHRWRPNVTNLNSDKVTPASDILCYLVLSITTRFSKTYDLSMSACQQYISDLITRNSPSVDSGLNNLNCQYNKRNLYTLWGTLM